MTEPRWRSSLRRWAPQAAACLGFALVYILVAQLAFYLATAHKLVASVWPPAGLALGILILFGLRLWPGIFIGALLANGWNGFAWPAAAMIAVGNSLAAVSGAYALRRLKLENDLHRVRDALLLLAVALLSPVMSATIGTLSLGWTAGLAPELALTIWGTWWSGDVFGILLMTPLFLVWADGRRPELSRRRLLEAGLLGASLVAGSVVLMRTMHGYEYAILPLVGWAAIRGGPRGASLATLLVGAVAMWYSAVDLGASGLAGDHHSIWQRQLFLALLSTKALVMGSMAGAQLKAAGALRASEQRFRRIFEHSALGICVFDSEGDITAANPAFTTMLGYSQAELLGCTIADISHPEDTAAEKDRLRELLAGRGVPFRTTKRYMTKKGRIIWAKLTATHVPGEGGPGYGIGLIEDITEQRAAEEALARDADERREWAEQMWRTSQTLQTLIDASPLAIMTLDAAGRLRSWNAAAEDMFGWPASEVLGQVVPFIPAESMEEFRHSLRRVFGGEALTGLQAVRHRRDGQRIDVRICAAPTRDPKGVIDGAIALVEDVTERKNLGEQLRQAQKMEAIGQLTGGIAHDFNNLLTIVITNAALLAGELDSARTEMRAELAELQRAALRGVELVRKLMAFSRRRSVELQPVNLGQVVKDASSDLQRLLPASVEVAVQVEPGVPLTVIGDTGAMEQMLFNLATNARDAMADGGTLRLSVYRAWLDEDHLRTRGWGSPGEYVVVAVSDTGCGMSPSVQSRVFEPFYTTKEVGKGTGLGMAMVYGLVTQHKGYADLQSAEGRGTTVRLYFPAVDTPLRSPGEPAGEGTPVGGTERILVVDDEEGIRRSAVRVLSRFGYAVDEASDGHAAITAIRDAKAPFNLVLTDVVMPRMGGLALYQELRKEGSTVPVILMSGHTADDIDHLADPVSGARFLHKPWSVTDLLRRVRDVLDDRSGAAA